MGKLPRRNGCVNRECDPLLSFLIFSVSLNYVFERVNVGSVIKYPEYILIDFEFTTSKDTSSI